MTDNLLERRLGPIVAVTGHRDLPPEDLPLLAQALDRTLREIQAMADKGIPTLLSGLAEGADRLAAERALELGWRVVGVLALPAEEFEEDFASEASREAFRRHLGQCLRVIEVSPAGTPRPQCYANVADHLISMSDWLVALWDGAPAAGSGGTADVVERFLAHWREVDPSGPERVAHLVTRRSSCGIAHPESGPSQRFWIRLDSDLKPVRRAM